MFLLDFFFAAFYSQFGYGRLGICINYYYLGGQPFSLILGHFEMIFSIFYIFVF